MITLRARVGMAIAVTPGMSHDPAPDLIGHESPSRRFCKPALGRVVVQHGSGEERHEYIAVVRRDDGTLAYVLNEWRAPQRPGVVPEAVVRAVEPFGRPTC